MRSGPSLCANSKVFPDFQWAGHTTVVLLRALELILEGWLGPSCASVAGIASKQADLQAFDE